MTSIDVMHCEFSTPTFVCGGWVPVYGSAVRVNVAPLVRTTAVQIVLVCTRSVHDIMASSVVSCRSVFCMNAVSISSAYYH